MPDRWFPPYTKNFYDQINNEIEEIKYCNCEIPKQLKLVFNKSDNEIFIIKCSRCNGIFGCIDLKEFFSNIGRLIK